MRKIRPIWCQFVQFCRKIFVHSSTLPCTFKAHKYISVISDCFASSVYGLSLFGSFWSWYTLKSPWVYNFRQILGNCTYTTKELTSLNLPILQMNLSHSIEHYSKWILLRCSFKICFCFSFRSWYLYVSIPSHALQECASWWIS